MDRIVDLTALAALSWPYRHPNLKDFELKESSTLSGNICLIGCLMASATSFATQGTC